MMKKAWLVLAGLLPLLVGYLLNHLMMTVFYTVRLPYNLISLLYLALWCLLGFLMFPLAPSVKQGVLLAHIPACAAFLLILFQELVLGHYWINQIGLATQFFYLPLVSLAYMLTFFTSSMSVVYLISFLLMIGAFYLGCSLGKWYRLRRKSPSA